MTIDETRVETARRAGFPESYRSVLLDGRPVGRLRRSADGRWVGFTTFTDNTPAARELNWTPAGRGRTPEETALAVAAEYEAENGAT